MVKEHLLDDGSVFIRCWTAGSGRPVLLLHEWGESLRSVTRIFHDFASSFAVTAIDLPGHGRSGVPGRPWDLSDYSTSLLNIMDKLPLDQPDIVAHGFGGRIAIKLASAQPARVGNLVLVDTLGIGEGANAIHALKASVPWPKLLGGKARLGADSTRWIHEEATREDLKPLLSSIRSRTLLVWGDKDRKVTPAVGLQMKKLIPHSSIVFLEGAGHFSYQDQFTEFSRVVKGFLDNVPELQPHPAEMPAPGTEYQAYPPQPPLDEEIVLDPALGATPEDRARQTAESTRAPAEAGALNTQEAARAEVAAFRLRKEAAQAQAKRDAEIVREAAINAPAEAGVLHAQETARAAAAAVRLREEAALSLAKRKAGIEHEAAVKLLAETEVLKAREVARAEAAAILRREEAAQAQAKRDAEIAREAAIKAQAEAEARQAWEVARAEAAAILLREEEAQAQAKRDAEIAREAAIKAQAEAEARQAREVAALAQARRDEEKLHAAALAQAQADDSQLRNQATQAQAKHGQDITPTATPAASTKTDDLKAWQEAQWAKAEADAILARQQAAPPRQLDGSVFRAAGPADLYLDWEAGRIRYRMAGAGKPIMLLHDWGSSMESMDLIFDALVPANTVVAIDFPGHGKSGELRKAMAIPDFVNLLLAVQHKLQLHKLRLLGHSFGGRVAISFAQAYPGKVEKLVLENTRIVGLDQKSILRPLKPAALQYESPSLRETFLNLAKKDFSLVTPPLKSPALLIWGEDDPDAATASRDHKLIPGSELLMLKRAGHLAHVQQSGMFLLVTKRFLRDGTLGPPPAPRR